MLKSVYIYGSYRKIKTRVSLFWTTLCWRLMWKWRSYVCLRVAVKRGVPGHGPRVPAQGCLVKCVLKPWLSTGRIKWLVIVNRLTMTVWRRTGGPRRRPGRGHCDYDDASATSNTLTNWSDHPPCPAGIVLGKSANIEFDSRCQRYILFDCIW